MVEGAGAIPQGNVSPISEHQSEQQREQTERAREKTRGRIAYILIGALVVIVLGTFVYVIWMSLRFADLTADVLISVLQIIGTTLLAPLVGLIGAVIGFYYGGQTAVRGAQQSTQAATQATRAVTQAASELSSQTPTDQSTQRPIG